MILWKTIDIADNERALLYRRGRFLAVLGPGRHRVARLLGSLRDTAFSVGSLPGAVHDTGSVAFRAWLGLEFYM